MAFKVLSSEELTKLNLVQDVTIEELTELVSNKDTFLRKIVKVEDLLDSNGTPGTFTYVNQEGQEVSVKVPLLSIVPIPSIPIDVIPSFDKQYNN